MVRRVRQSISLLLADTGEAAHWAHVLHAAWPSTGHPGEFSADIPDARDFRLVSKTSHSKLCALLIDILHAGPVWKRACGTQGTAASLSGGCCRSSHGGRHTGPRAESLSGHGYSGRAACTARYIHAGALPRLPPNTSHVAFSKPFPVSV